MAWVKIDDQAPRNAKLLRAGPAAAWMWLCGIAHGQAQMTEGFIEDIAIDTIGVRGAERSRKLADALVECGLFERVEGGYQVHDYLDFNETREEALARKVTSHAGKVAAGRAGGIASGIARSNEAKRKQVLEANRSPDPTRPDLKKEPPNPLSAKGGRLRILRADRQEAKRLLKQNFGHCTHEPKHISESTCLAEIAAALAERRRDAERAAAS